MPKTTIIIVSHNYGHFLSWCVQSALHQTRPPKEVIIINDSSTDNTEDIALSFCGKATYYKVEFRDAQRTRNFALSRASGEYVLYLDADDFLDNDALLLMENAIDRNPSLRIVYGDRINFGAPEKMSQAGFPYHWISKDFSIDGIRQSNFISMPSLLRKSTFGGFDERIRLNQDWEAWLGTVEADDHAVRVPRPVYYHRFHGKNKTFNEKEYTERFKAMIKHDLIETIRPEVEDPSNQNFSLPKREVHFVLHSIERLELEELIKQLRTLKRIKGHIHILGNPVSTHLASISNAVREAGFVVELHEDVTIEGFLRGFKKTASRFISTTDLVCISNFSGELDPAFSALNVSETRPIVATQGDKEALLAIRNLEEIPFLTLNGTALRHLLYLYSRPPTYGEKVANRLRDWMDRHLSWRLSRIRSRLARHRQE